MLISTYTSIQKFGFVKILLLLVYFSVFNMINMKKIQKHYTDPKLLNGNV